MADIRSEIVVTRDEGVTRTKALEAALEHVLMRKPLPDYARQYEGKRFSDICADVVRQVGGETAGYGRADIVRRAFRIAGHTTDDFPAIFANVAHKLLVAAFEGVSDYRRYEMIGTREDFPDYREKAFVNLLGFGVLPKVDEGAEYTGVTTGDFKEVSTLQKFGGELRLTKEMIAADDLGAFARALSELGAAAQRTCSQVALTQLTTQVCGDGKDVFHADHKNLASDAGAPTAARLAELDTLLRAQTDANGNAIGLPGAYIIAPVELRKAIEALYSPQLMVTDPEDANIVGIPAENRLYVPGLSGNAYYMTTADKSAFIWGFLAEEGGPVLTRYPDETTDSIIYHASVSFGAVVTKYQRFAKNAGATE